jgi:hypothetical protein
MSQPSSECLLRNFEESIVGGSYELKQRYSLTTLSGRPRSKKSVALYSDIAKAVAKTECKIL